MDVASIASRRLDPRSRHLLPGPGTTQLPPQDAARRNSSIRDEEALPRGDTSPGQRSSLSAYLRNEPTKAT